MSQKALSKTKVVKAEAQKKIAFFDQSTSDGMTRLYGVIFKPSASASSTQKKGQRNGK